MDANSIIETEFGQPTAERGIIAVACVGECDTLGKIVCNRLFDLVERDLRLGLEGDVVRHARLLTPCWVVRPGLGKIEPQRNW